MTDRDLFAAAALAGLLTRREYDACEFATACEYSYRYADAMLRERDATTEKVSDVRDSRNANTTDLDAAPAAKASVESVVPQPTTRGDSDRTDKAAPRPSEGTGDTPIANDATTGGDDRPQPVKDCDTDRPKPIAHTPPTHPTPGECSKPREGT